MGQRNKVEEAPMNGLESIRGKILEEAGQEIGELESKTRCDCEAISEKAEADAKTAYWEVMHAGAEASARRSERAHSMAAMEVKKQVLAEKQAMVDQAFEKALEKLCALPETEYVELLAGFAVRAAVGGEKLIFSPADRNRVGKAVVLEANRRLEAAGKAAGLTLSEQTRAIRGGLILENGRVETNCSFETLVEQSRNQLTGEVARLLFD